MFLALPSSLHNQRKQALGRGLTISEPTHRTESEATARVLTRHWRADRPAGSRVRAGTAARGGLLSGAGSRHQRPLSVHPLTVSAVSFFGSRRKVSEVFVSIWNCGQLLFSSFY